MPKRIRHIASGRDFDVPDDVFRLGGAAMTRWCDNKVAEEQLANDKAEIQRLETLAAEQQKRQAAEVELDELKALVLTQSQQINALQDKLNADAPVRASDAADRLALATSRVNDLTARLNLAATELERKHAEHVVPAEQLLREELADTKRQQAEMRQRNKELFASMRAKAVAEGQGDDLGFTTDDIEAY